MTEAINSVAVTILVLIFLFVFAAIIATFFFTTMAVTD